MDKIKQLQDIIDVSSDIVFFGGAGVSTESGIPDFRSTDGLYSQTYGDYPPETILSAGFFMHDKELFYKFYREKILMQGSGLTIKPNIAHYKLAELEKAGKLKAIITQNIDMLHQEAGSKTVYQIHGNIAKYYCLGHQHEHDLQYVLQSDGIPKCPDCAAALKPDIVLYDEPLPSEIWNAAQLAIEKADTLIVAGTSLSVYPAVSLLNYFHGDHLVIINKTKTPSDGIADCVIHDSLGKVLEQIKIN